MIITVSLRNDVHLRNKFFLNLYFRLRKTIIKNLETKNNVIIYNLYFYILFVIKKI